MQERRVSPKRIYGRRRDPCEVIGRKWRLLGVSRRDVEVALLDWSKQMVRWWEGLLTKVSIAAQSPQFGLQAS